jgi:hypothetical protein
MRAGVMRGEDRAVNPTLARTLLALSYPLRLTAHLTQPPGHHAGTSVDGSSSAGSTTHMTR